MESIEGWHHEKLLDAVLYHLAESLRITAILISPLVPRAAHGIFDQLNWKIELSGKEEHFSLADAEWVEIAGRTCCRQTCAVVPANRVDEFLGQPHRAACRRSVGQTNYSRSLIARILRRRRVRHADGRELRPRNGVNR
jgi:hypothetical protein